MTTDLIAAEARTTAWEALGHQLPQGLNALQAIQHGGLDWEVEKVPATAAIYTPEVIDLEGVSPARTEYLDSGRIATVRVNKDGSRQVLGIGMSKTYGVVQNIEAAAEIQAAADATDAEFAAVGSQKDGSQMFVQMWLPSGSFNAGGNDPHQTYLTAVNSHDGTRALTFTVGTLRMFCTNQVAVNNRTAITKVSFRHTSGIKAAMVNANKVLGLTQQYVPRIQAATERLYQTPMARDEFSEFINELFPAQIKKAGKDKGQETAQSITRREALHGLWVSESMTNLPDNRLRAYNAVTEYQDWAMPVKGGNRFERIAQGGGDAVKARAMALLLA